MSTSTPMAMMARAAPALVHNPFILVIAMQNGQHRRHKKEDAVHDPQRKTGLEHGARLVDGNVDAVEARAPKDAEGLVNAAARFDAGAVGLCDPAEVVDACDQGANEAQVDEADEARVGLGAVIAEEREDGPGCPQDGDNEEDEDVVGR